MIYEIICVQWKEIIFKINICPKNLIIKMKMKNILLWALILLNSAVLAQESSKWGKPSAQEVSMQVCSFDSTANAVILFESGSVSFGSVKANIRVYRKIKILNADGIDNATIELFFYHKNDLEDITDIKAQTINTDNGEISKTEIKKDNFYTKIINSRWSSISFTFPAVKVGSIVEYKYTLNTKRIYFLDDWVFQHEIPTIYSEIDAQIPSSLRYSILLFGDKIKAKYNSKENKRSSWNLSNLKGYASETNVFCYDDYVEKLQFQLLSYESSDYAGYYRGSETVDVLNDWDKLAAEIWEEYKPFLNRSGKAKDILETLVKADDIKNAKIRSIYNFVWSNIKWNKEYHIYPTKAVGEVLSSRSGNSADINLLLCLLLNEAGIDAYPVLISTKRNGKITKNYPMLDQFIHVIVALPNDNTYKFIDVISLSNNCFMIPAEHVNYYGFLLNKDKGKFIDIRYQVESKEGSTVVCRFDSSKVIVQSSRIYSGYNATDQRLKHINKKNTQSELLNFVSDAMFVKDSCRVKNLDDEYLDFSESSFYSSNYNPGDKIILNLNIDEIENPYKQMERLFPVENDFPFSKQSRFTFLLPKGYIIDGLPKNVSIGLPGNAGKFVYSVTYSGNQLSLLIKQDIDFMILPKESYQILKEFYNQIVMKLNEPIIIEKQL